MSARLCKSVWKREREMKRKIRRDEERKEERENVSGRHKAKSGGETAIVYTMPAGRRESGRREVPG